MFLISNFKQMKNIKFNPFKYLFSIFLCLTLSACSGGLNAGLEAFKVQMEDMPFCIQQDGLE